MSAKAETSPGKCAPARYLRDSFWGYSGRHRLYPEAIISVPLDLPQLALIALAALAAGAVNAIAGGGTLITFPALTFVGVPAVAASVTNTVALSPGYLSATFAQWNDLKPQRHRLLLLAPVAVIGGIVGGLLLLNTGERVFRQLIPFLILLASVLLALQGRLRKWIVARQAKHVKR
ncbi:MAG TPA: sulfite exporter TauE/SafE family protein, partial [Thermoflexales bacterium]|nr:sulfite exporter TauE/SafE family protein [Thermoflexales bacterium]